MEGENCTLRSHLTIDKYIEKKLVKSDILPITTELEFASDVNAACPDLNELKFKVKAKNIEKIVAKLRDNQSDNDGTRTKINEKRISDVQIGRIKKDIVGIQRKIRMLNVLLSNDVEAIEFFCGRGDD